MEPVQVITGRALPLDRSDVDTDQIIPAEWLKRVERTGFGEGLFGAWRKDASFPLNDKRYEDATVLIAGPNFGTGSSREHAVWALTDYGFKVVISSRFADIFRGNSGKAGLLAAQVSQDTVDKLWALVEADPTTEVTVDLEAREVRAGDVVAAFDIDDYTRWRLLEGLDDIGITLSNEDSITAYEATRPSWKPATL